MEHHTTFVAMDTHKTKISVALAEGVRNREVRFLGEIANKPDAIKRLVDKLASWHGELKFCYEAGPCGYGIHRQITRLGHECMVVAPSLVPTRPGDHVNGGTR